MDLKTLKQFEKIVNNAKEDIKKELKKYATKTDLKSALTKALVDYPTKKDLKRELDDLAVELTLSTDRHKAEKSKVGDLEKRIDRIEEELQISTI